MFFKPIKSLYLEKDGLLDRYYENNGFVDLKKASVATETISLLTRTNKGIS